MRPIPAPVAAAVRWMIAALLDLAASFVGFGYLVGYLTGAVDDDGIALSPAAVGVTFALMGGYFVVLSRLGGTPWQRLLGAPRVAPQAPDAL